MIELRGLTKRFGRTVAVDDVTLDVAPGRVTGFLGPNGAGKTTTMRMVLGLDRPTAGTATVRGRRYDQLDAPLREVGALLDAAAVHPGRRARSHLLAMARSHRIPATRVDEVLETVGLSQVARKRIGGFSLGMRQRLGIAGALLGDPPVLLFDEPVNGLDPEGVRWVRDLARRAADEGRTVLISSHLMSEMQQTADHLIVIGRGRVIADEPIEQLMGRSRESVVVASPEPDRLAAALRRETVTVTAAGEGRLEVTGATAAQVGDAAFEAGVRLHQLSGRSSSLEDVFMELTEQSAEFVGGGERTVTGTDERHRAAGLGGAMAAEWTKLVTVRSTWWVLAVTVAVVLGIAALASLAPDGGPPLAVTTAAFAGMGLAQLSVAVLATLAITAEHSTGSLTSTLQWIPVRPRLLGAKTIVVLGVAFVIGALTYLPAVGLAAVVRTGAGDLQLGDVVRGAVAAGGLLAAVSGLALGLGTALRSTAGALVTVVALLLVLAPLLGIIPVEVIQRAAQYLPGAATGVVFTGDGPYSEPVAWIVLWAWAVVALGLGAVLLTRRDA